MAIGNGVCATATGECSLRAAIQEANFTGSADVITVPPGVYLFTLPGIDDLSFAGDLDVTGPITIQGAGMGSTIIDGGGIDRVFDLFGSTDGLLRT